MRPLTAAIFALLLCALASSAEARSENLVRVRLRPHETVRQMMHRKHINRGYYREILIYNDLTPSAARHLKTRRHGIRLAFPASFLHRRPSKSEIRRSAKLLRASTANADGPANFATTTNTGTVPKWAARKHAPPAENNDVSALPSWQLPETGSAATITIGPAKFATDQAVVAGSQVTQRETVPPTKPRSPSSAWAWLAAASVAVPTGLVLRSAPKRKMLLSLLQPRPLRITD